MARRSSQDLGSSLFPFLSVLACVIGTLTLLIASLAIGQVAESLLDAREDSAQREQLEAKRAELREVKAQLAKASNIAEELAAARAQVRALGFDPDDSQVAIRPLARRRATTGSGQCP